MERLLRFLKRTLLWLRIYRLDLLIDQFAVAMRKSKTTDDYLAAKLGIQSLEMRRTALRAEYQATFPAGHRITWAY